MDSLEELEKAINKFVSDRDWNQFHTPENLAKSISIEANELLECFQWSNDYRDKEHVKDELADVINYCLQLAHVLDVDVKEIVLNKLEKTAKKYPITECKGKALKYTAYHKAKDEYNE